MRNSSLFITVFCLLDKTPLALIAFPKVLSRALEFVQGECCCLHPTFIHPLAPVLVSLSHLMAFRLNYFRKVEILYVILARWRPGDSAYHSCSLEAMASFENSPVSVSGFSWNPESFQASILGYSLSLTWSVIHIAIAWQTGPWIS